jgi:hypothetical protein
MLSLVIILATVSNFGVKLLLRKSGGDKISKVTTIYDLQYKDQMFLWEQVNFYERNLPHNF